MKKYRAGLFGLGVVGGGVYRALADNDNFPVRIDKIAVKNPSKERGFSVNKNLLFTEAAELIEDKQLDIIIELINDPFEAFQIVSEALKNGKSVVTANKKMLSIFAVELKKLACESKGVLLYEGAVCGSIPIIRLLDQHFNPAEVQKITTIANGTANYVLTKMSAKGWSYHNALKEAQSLGFAEKDPHSDVSGEDTRFKLSLLILHSFSIHISPERIPMIGIEAIDKVAIDFANEIGAKIKLLGKAEYSNGKLSASVMPGFVSSSDDLFNVDDEFNAVYLDTALAGVQLFKGKGAGSAPTSSAVLSNLLDISRGISYDFGNEIQIINEPADGEAYFYVAGTQAILPNLNFHEIVFCRKNHLVVQASVRSIGETLKDYPSLTIIRFPESLLEKLPQRAVLI